MVRSVVASILIALLIASQPVHAQSRSFEVDRVEAERMLDANSVDEAAFRKVADFVARARTEYGPRSEAFAKLQVKYAAYLIAKVSTSTDTTGRFAILHLALQPAAEGARTLKRLKPGSLDAVNAIYADGLVRLANGNTALALKTLSEAVALDRKLRAGQETEIADLLVSLAGVLERFDLWSQVEAVLRQALDLRVQVHGSTSRELIPTLLKLWTAEIKQGHSSTAREGLKAIIDTMAEADRSDTEWLLLSSLITGEINEKIELPDEPEALRLIKVMEYNAGKLAKSFYRATAQIDIIELRAQLAMALGQTDVAARYYREAVNGSRKALKDAANETEKGVAHVYLVGALKFLGGTEVAAGEWSNAKRSLDEVLELVGDNTISHADTFASLAEINRNLGNTEEANRRLASALALRKLEQPEIPIYFATSRQGQAKPALRFGAAYGGGLTLGKATVVAPQGFRDRADHNQGLVTAGSLNIPQTTLARSLAILALDTHPTDNVLTEAFSHSNEAFATAGSAMPSRSVLVFVHGYNVSFENGIRSTAQLVHDLNLGYPAFLFSWPSQGALTGYFTDQSSAAKSCPLLADFIEKLGGTNGASKIHIIAHSMGNQVLVCALQTLARRATVGNIAPKIGEIIFASPDVDVQEFRSAIAKASSVGLKRLTLYASAHDKALWARQMIGWGNARAGLVSNGTPVTAEDLDSIDLSNAGQALFNLNHGVFAVQPVVVEDIRRLLTTGQHPPGGRIPQLTKVAAEGSTVFWRYEAPAGKAAAKVPITSRILGWLKPRTRP